MFKIEDYAKLIDNNKQNAFELMKMRNLCRYELEDID
jgi:hypothetical protein